MEITFTSKDGRTWRSNDLLSSGDYLPGGALARSNKRIITAEIEDDPGADWCTLPCSWLSAEAGEAEIGPEVRAVILHEGYGSEIMFLVDTDPVWEGLEQYPALDDADMSELELEEQDEAWADWARADLLRGCEWEDLGFSEDEGHLPEDLEHWVDDCADWLESHFENRIEEMFYAACDTSNTYWTQDGDAQWIDLDRVRPEFCRIAREELALEPRLALEAAGQLALDLDLPTTRTLERYI